MKSHETLGENPFIGPLLDSSAENVLQFLPDTLNRFKSNDTTNLYKTPVGELDVLTVQITSAVKEKQLGDRISATRGVVELIADIIVFGRKLYAAVESSFENADIILPQFFPKGLTGLNQANRGDYGVMLQTWIDKATFYKADLAAKWLTKSTDFKKEWDSLVLNQSKEKSEVNTNSDVYNNLLPAIADKLWELELMVVLNNRANAVDALKIYFDLAPLNRSSNSDNDGLGRASGLVTDNAGNPIANAAIVITDAANQIVYSGSTNRSGQWRSPNVNIGFHTITVSKTGFTTVSIPNKEILDFKDIVINTVLTV